jgi:hypothetical protein
MKSCHPLFWIFDAVSFVDVGNVFQEFRLSFELRTAGGFVADTKPPVVLRFDYGFKPDRRRERRRAFLQYWAVSLCGKRLSKKK